ncbi:MAG: type IX secretion system outer membrane channel protein PorV [Bacteroidota bacterium]
MEALRCSLNIGFFIALITLSGSVVRGQITPGQMVGAQLNTLQTSVPFLTIAPDARAAGMGDAGVATSADVNSQHWNVAKYAFVERKGAFAITHIPWLRNLIPGINLGYLSGYYRIDDKNTVSSSFRYFSLGEITYSSIQGRMVSQYKPFEFALDAGYTRLFTEHFSGGMAIRYIRSDLTSGQTTANGLATQAGQSVAGDLALYYQNDVPMGQTWAQWALGMNISNMGTPISYTKNATKTPIPTNLRLGGRFEYFINENHSFSLNADMNKLLVPTPPVMVEDTATGDLIVIRGKAAPESVVAGMFQSFRDAPGVLRADGSYSVFLEEMHEIAFAMGAEYNFQHLLSVRSGYFHEHSTKGNRKYITAGICVKNRLFSLDVAYLRPTNGGNSPLANTFRITFTTELGGNSRPFTQETIFD